MTDTNAPTATATAPATTATAAVTIPDLDTEGSNNDNGNGNGNGHSSSANNNNNNSSNTNPQIITSSSSYDNGNGNGTNGSGNGTNSNSNGNGNGNSSNNNNNNNNKASKTSSASSTTIQLWQCQECNLFNYLRNDICDACFNPAYDDRQIIKLEKELSEEEICGAVLRDEKESIGKRMRMCFELKQMSSVAAIKQLNKGFASRSALLKHEIAYVLGQIGHRYAITYLNAVLENEAEECIVRHEAAEAIAAIGNLTRESLQLLNYFAEDEATDESLRNTCKLALSSSEFCLTHYVANCQEYDENHGNQVTEVREYSSVDPAPPFDFDDYSLEDLRRIFLSGIHQNQDQNNSNNNNNNNEAQKEEECSLFDRYRAMFTLRDLGSKQAKSKDECVQILCLGFADKCALFKHEIAFVLGQMMSKIAVPTLLKVLKNENEIGMVRHEAAEAIGNIIDEKDAQILEYVQQLSQGKPNNNSSSSSSKNDGGSGSGSVPDVVTQSCEVAIDMFKFWHKEK